MDFCGVHPGSAGAKEYQEKLAAGWPPRIESIEVNPQLVYKSLRSARVSGRRWALSGRGGRLADRWKIHQRVRTRVKTARKAACCALLLRVNSRSRFR